MSTTYQIAEIARRSGFTTTALRYYEDVGLMAPVARTPAGYRLYDDTSLARLAFIARAKQLGCTLQEITDLLTAWEGERCAPVQSRLRHLVAGKIADAQRRTAELVAFTGQLQQAASTLGDHTPDGPCDDDCGCTSDRAGHPPEPVALTPGDGEPEIACTLETTAMPGRMADWQRVLAGVTEREPLDGGVRLVLAPTADLTDVADVAEVARLAAAEQGCCAFFRFALTVDERGVALEVRAPDAAQGLVQALFGASARDAGDI